MDYVSGWIDFERMLQPRAQPWDVTVHSLWNGKIKMPVISRCAPLLQNTPFVVRETTIHRLRRRQ